MEESIVGCTAEGMTESAVGCTAEGTAGSMPCSAEREATGNRIDFLALTKECFQLKEVDIRTYSPLTLAYIGDAVYDLIFRTVVVQRGNTSASRLHQQAVRYVKASAQAELAERILGELSPEELAVYKRGKNAKPHTMAKNATMAEYKKATGLEALVGYLYLAGRLERVLELVQTGLDSPEVREEDTES